MAKRICPHCRKKDVHHKATVCPYCQKQIQPVSFWKTRFGIFLIIIGGLWIFGTISSQFNPDSSKSQQMSQPELDKAKAAREKFQEKNRKEFEDKKALYLQGSMSNIARASTVKCRKRPLRTSLQKMPTYRL